MPRLAPITKRKFIKKISEFGLEVVAGRGKGGEWIIIQPSTGIIFTMPHLAEGEDVKVPYILSVLRRFNISREDWLK